MRVVSPDEMRALSAAGALLFHRTALGHAYGVQRSEVKRVQASGRVCVLEVRSIIFAHHAPSALRLVEAPAPPITADCLGATLRRHILLSACVHAP
jgi:hypothetical protein